MLIAGILRIWWVSFLFRLIVEAIDLTVFDNSF